MNATATAEPIARKGATGHIDLTGAGIPPTRPAQPERLTDAEKDRLWAESKNYEDFTDKAIAGGKLTGYLDIDRYIRPQPTRAELREAMERIAAENPGRFITAEEFRRKTQ
jgi:hypothetical protein